MFIWICVEKSKKPGRRLKIWKRIWRKGSRLITKGRFQRFSWTNQHPKNIIYYFWIVYHFPIRDRVAKNKFVFSETVCTTRLIEFVYTRKFRAERRVKWLAWVLEISAREHMYPLMSRNLFTAVLSENMGPPPCDLMIGFAVVVRFYPILRYLTGW